MSPFWDNLIRQNITPCESDFSAVQTVEQPKHCSTEMSLAFDSGFDSMWKTSLASTKNSGLPGSRVKFSIDSILSDQTPARSYSIDIGTNALYDICFLGSDSFTSSSMVTAQEAPIDLSVQRVGAQLVVADKLPGLNTGFVCRFCEKAYTSRSSIRLHEATHTLPFQCGDCGKRFSRPWLRDIHHRTHTGEKPYTCEICQRRFADRSNMRAHQRVHKSHVLVAGAR
ncbi:hypothetical protein P879_08694 [Paragonimus westermani]|uniref:C2H2-type domain-containing protein n=1 Tax=Paragonimus westermani TaxID=34504 RepID=A0A8T0DMN0_9TREM|nr:hypothetical protein P879_08694 [Paragonimus westermani]